MEGGHVATRPGEFRAHLRLRIIQRLAGGEHGDHGHNVSAARMAATSSLQQIFKFNVNTNS